MKIFQTQSTVFENVCMRSETKQEANTEPESDNHCSQKDHTGKQYQYLEKQNSKKQKLRELKKLDD